MAKYGVLGSGDVGKTLARGLAARGHDVVIGTRSRDKLAALANMRGIRIGSPDEAAEDGEIVIIAVQGAAAEALVASLAPSLAGKVVIDTTNPIAGPPVGGLLPYFTTPEASLMERLMAKAPTARFVKAFNSAGSALMVDPKFQGGRATMFIAGDDADAKRVVTDLLDSFGWDTEDAGGAALARPLEALCQLWCAPGFLRGDWAHAFKFVRP